MKTYEELVILFRIIMNVCTPLRHSISHPHTHSCTHTSIHFGQLEWRGIHNYRYLPHTFPSEREFRECGSVTEPNTQQQKITIFTMACLYYTNAIKILFQLSYRSPSERNTRRHPNRVRWCRCICVSGEREFFRQHSENIFQAACLVSFNES